MFINIKKYHIISILLIFIGIYSGKSNATGVIPDTTVLIISEETDISHMGVKNTENEPLLLITTILDVPEDKGVTVLALPAVTRIEANGRQIVRFILDKSSAPLKFQHMKRVQFEGIPMVQTGDGKSSVKVSVRQNIPVIISPIGLKQDLEPWRYLELKWNNGEITLSNPSPYVIRLSQNISILPSSLIIKVLPRTYILPGEKFNLNIPYRIPDNVNSVQIFPASPYGFDVPPYNVTLNR